MQKIAKNLPSGHHRTNLSGCIFTTEAFIDNRKNLLNSDIFSTYPNNMVNFDPVTADIGLLVGGTPANFNGFRLLVSLLQRRRWSEANQTLRDVWPFPGLVHYIYIIWSTCPGRNFARCKIHFTSKSCVLLCWQRYCTALQQRALAKLCGVVHGMELQNFRRGTTYIWLGGHHVGHRPTF